MRELYKSKPGREIVHAHMHTLDPEKVSEFDRKEEHIVSKTGRFVEQLLRLAELLSALGQNFGETWDARDFVSFCRKELRANGWQSYPELCKLAQVAPLDLTEQAFLSRCKNIHELWQQLPNACLRDILVHAGHTRAALNKRNFGSLKLLQSIANVLERLNRDGESLGAFGSGADAEDLDTRNAALAPLFVNNDLRIADAHNSGTTLVLLEKLDFDIAAINQGYGRALDHVLDGVIGAFEHVNRELEGFIMR